MDNAAEKKQAALNDLRIWRSWFDRRDPLIYAAHVSGATLAEIREASGVAKNTARTAIAAQEEAMTATTDTLAKFHHPNFVSAEPGRFEGEWKFTWKPFTGREEEPLRPVESYGNDDLSSEDRKMLELEYRAATEMWGTARFHLKARPQISSMAMPWNTYRRARAAMEDTYDSLLSTADTNWRAQVMKLTDLHHKVLAAAKDWDKAAAELALIHKEYERTVGAEESYSISHLVSGYETNTQGWDLRYHHEYDPSDRYIPHGEKFQTPAVKESMVEIERQKSRIREVADLAGDR
ncbi:hypothetical protein QIS99_28675 [Streptomyces sp. B-S-A8]|uniref:Uncharacterized protein n=1 Tax=Streptomyces solicavernae TaxID=3043614 RepID=A0ABT6S0M7_9ACTN|nr:hypothetical protein [Streptomyces sp. B-S-A8]MDI3390135.1 hypothetical protein [Streptomyces sp. B-S-A8]